MRKKLIALIGAGLLLTGCSATGETGAPTPQATSSPTPQAQGSKWDEMTFCKAFEDQRETYQESLDSPDGVRVSELAAVFNGWSDKLKLSAPTEMAEDVATFTSPIYMTESGSVSLIEVFGAGNSIAGYCIGKS